MKEYQTFKSDFIFLETLKCRNELKAIFCEILRFIFLQMMSRKIFLHTTINFVTKIEFFHTKSVKTEYGHARKTQNHCIRRNIIFFLLFYR